MQKTDRRTILQAGPVAGAAGILSTLTTDNSSAATTTKRDYLAELGVPPVINAVGVYTAVTGSLMHPDAVEAIASLSRHFVRLDDLHAAVGARIAKRLGCEAASVTAGAAAALTLGTAACIAGTSADAIRRLPDTTGLKNEVIIQKSHRYPYDHAVRNCGIRMIEVETAAELKKAVNPRTAMMLYLFKATPMGAIKAEEFVALGKQLGVPTFVDAAADVPPVDNIYKLAKSGFDLVTFSGGKGIRGPQSAGLLLGRRDLIESARLQTGAHSDSIGRPMKVSKEEIVGMMVALEAYLARDHAADWRRWEDSIATITAAVKNIPGVTCERYVPVIANQVPHLRVTWNMKTLPLTHTQVVDYLRKDTPQIEVVPVEGPRPGPGLDMIEMAMWMMEPGEPAIVATRLRAALKSAKQG